MPEAEEEPTLKARVRNYLMEKGVLDLVLEDVRSRIVARDTGSFKEEELEVLLYELLKSQLPEDDYAALLQMVPGSS